MVLMEERVDEASVLISWVVPSADIGRTDESMYGRPFVWLTTRDPPTRFFTR